MITEKRVSEKLKELGVNPKYLGFDYITTAILLIAEDESYKHRITTTKGLYATVAKEHNTTALRAEKSMRYVIQNKVNDPELSLMTNGAFLSALYERLKYEE